MVLDMVESRLNSTEEVYGFESKGRHGTMEGDMKLRGTKEFWLIYRFMMHWIKDSTA